jgi:hypothetical protein
MNMLQLAHVGWICNACCAVWNVCFSGCFHLQQCVAVMLCFIGV